MIHINILLPVYNERLRLESGIIKTISFMESIMGDEYILTIIDNASNDGTGSIAQKLVEWYPQVNYIRLESKGVGIAFRAGIRQNTAPIVGYMDIDLSTDIRHLQEVITLFEQDPELEMVNGSRMNKASDTRGRKWYRSLTSRGLTCLLKFSLNMKASDSICGFKFFRKNTAERLVAEAGDSDNGWFYIIELLLRAERNGCKIHELPVHWEDDHHSTVHVVKQIIEYCTQIIRLRKAFRTEKEAKK